MTERQNVVAKQRGLSEIDISPLRAQQTKNMGAVMDELRKTIDMVRAISTGSRIAQKRSFADFLSDRLVQATTEQTLMSAMERLAKLMDSDIGGVNEQIIKDFLDCASSDKSSGILAWLREYPRIAAMLCMLKKEPYLETIQGIEIDDLASGGVAIADIPHEINLTVTCLSPLAHGADNKAGNATLYRRMQALATNGNVITLPYYAGNAVRGQIRDLLADDFIRLLGLEPRKDKPPLALWFFHSLYAGGALEENSAAGAALKKMMGGTGTVKSKGIHNFRDTLPSLSLLGCALGNRILSGRARFSDLRPVCKQWGNGTVDAGELYEWVFLTRREDHENHEDFHGMIANTECLKAGTKLVGGMDVDMHATELERSALGRGIRLLEEKGYIGAENRRGLGRVSIEYDRIPDPEVYVRYVTDHKQEIMAYLTELGAISAPEPEA
jgi:hypothetical protein